MEKVYKIVMLGDEAVGKTSIIVQHVEKRFEESYKMTIGTDISAKLMELGGQNIYLLIWDIGGQKKYKILRDSYLRGAFGAIIVYDVTNKNTYNHIIDWYDEAVQYCGTIPVILVGNKIDLSDERLLSKEDGLKKAKEINAEFYETSAKTGESINKVFATLVDKIIEK
ncbi:MAG: GTP-binding protein [Candidatus Helarchaeota archaeon]|nr:GTP-binding protein [Candidatus Helarchaeota archaeon]